ncbi:MAG TPA: hypothetical protein VFF73_32060 [Planctomycetota bacterium]|nr:hypothetical protein [Planctomycetota bacterium]
MRSSSSPIRGEHSLGTLIPQCSTGSRKRDVADEQRDLLLTSTAVFAVIGDARKMIERLQRMRNLKTCAGYKTFVRVFGPELKADVKAETLSSVLNLRLAHLGRPSRALKRNLKSVTKPDELERLVSIALEVETLAEFAKRAFPRRGRSDS